MPSSVRRRSPCRTSSPGGRREVGAGARFRPRPTGRLSTVPVDDAPPSGMRRRPMRPMTSMGAPSSGRLPDARFLGDAVGGRDCRRRGRRRGHRRVTDRRSVDQGRRRRHPCRRRSAHVDLRSGRGRFRSTTCWRRQHDLCFRSVTVSTGRRIQSHGGSVVGGWRRQMRCAPAPSSYAGRPAGPPPSSERGEHSPPHHPPPLLKCGMPHTQCLPTSRRIAASRDNPMMTPNTLCTDGRVAIAHRR